ncbi:MAG: hypothetical protein R3Y15_03380 [Rikenellaceae bacterium]
MKEVFEAYMRYGDLASEMMDGCSGVQKTLSQDDLDGLVEQYEWFIVARILRSRISNELDYQTKLLLATGNCPFTLVRPIADVIVETKDTPKKSYSIKPQSKPQQQTLKEIEPELVESKEVAEEVVAPSEQAQKSRSISIIDEFLSLDGEKLKIRPDDKTPTDDVSVNSIVSELDIVSEELAQIYLEQGYKNTAIQIYSKLSLLNPEKSVYFAGLIEKIK